MAKIITNEAIESLSKRRDIKLKIAEEFGLDEEYGIRTVNRWAKNNQPNNPLTCQASLVVLTKYLVMPLQKLTKDVEPKRKGTRL